MPELKPIDDTSPPYYLWKYLPSLPLSIAFASAFLLITLAHIARTIRSGTHFNHIFAIGGIFQVLGYAARIWARYYTNRLVPYILQNCFIVLAPVFYAASVYMCLSRIIRSSGGEAFAPFMPPRWITRVFVLADWVTLNVQGNGAGLTASDSPGVAKAGQGIVIAGLAVQLVTIAFFGVTAGVWHRRMAEHVRTEEAVGEEGREDGSGRPELPPWRQGLYLLYASSVLIGMRSVFRLIEYIRGTEGFLLGHEWPMYALDSSPMLLLQIIYVIWFPAEFKVEMGERRKKWMRLLR